MRAELELSRADKLQYVCDMLDQLKAMSGAAKGSILITLMDMAKLQAESELVAERGARLQHDRDAAI
ncbi:hypothetical protein [Mangrovicella endophytica]|uniref:hypothetical protein n=1 Tax=Mangrovicella endophytica TaxID=2066697 RepID=UPI0012FFE22F|nr:hypothetical protein [Mangrovicella endophytica]